MRSPKPPAPMKAAMVAVPTLITAEVLMPARIVGSASGSSTMPQDLPRASGRAPCRPGACPRGTCDEAGVRVARDRQQRVEEQRDQRRPRRRWCPVSGIRKASSASDGMVWITPVGDEHRLRQRAAACAASMPSGTPTRIARGERAEHQHQVLREQAPEVRRRTAPTRSRACRRLALPPKIFAPRPRAKLQPCRSRRAHSAASSSASSMRPSSFFSAAKACGKRLRQRRRGTAAPRRSAGKNCRSSSSTRRRVALDLGVGGVEVHHVDLARGDRLVGEAVVQAARRLRQP